MKCPSCGLEIPDDVEICPYCTAHVRRRVRIRAIYVIALVLMIVTGVYATLAYANAGVPVSKISSLSIDDNYRFVHVQGIVTGYPFAYETPYGVTQIGFTISDGTGQLTVKIYSNLVETAVKENKIPGLGDRVDVAGTFSYSSRKSLSVNDIYLLHIYRSTYRDVSVKEVMNASPWDFKSYERVKIVGNITGVRQYSFGDIATIDNHVDLLVPKAYLALHLLDMKNLGAGVVEFYGSMLYYQPVKPSSDYQVVNLSNVMKNPKRYNKTNIRLPWAQVIGKDELSNTIVVRANNTNVTVYTRDVKRIRIGAHVEIQGKFVNYHGIWEISAIRKTDYVSTPSWEIVAHPQFKVMEKKNYGKFPAPVNSFVTMNGVVADYRALKAGVLVTLWSNNSSYSVYIENEESVRGVLQPGAHVVVYGIVTEYNGQLEIKVRAYTNDYLEVKS